LDGSVHVTNGDLEPYLTYTVAKVLAEDTAIITKISAVREYIGIFENMNYVGYGSFKRVRYMGESTPVGERSNYVKGICVVAVTSMDILEEVYKGKLEIINGSMITEENNTAHHNKIVISAELAEKNGLSLGDTVTLDMPSLFQSEYEARFYEEERTAEEFAYVYIVGGIYQHCINNFAGVSVPYDLNANHVYVPITTVVDISERESIQNKYKREDPLALTVNPTVIPDALYFHLSNMDIANDMEYALNTIGFSEAIKLTEYVSDVSSSPSARLTQIVTYILIGVITVGFAVFLLATLFNMKARHREFAVLASLGKKRTHITLDFFIELACVIFVSLFASSCLLILVALLCAIPITNYLYSAEVSAQFMSENANFVLYGQETALPSAESMQDFHHLLIEYIIPSISFALLAGALLMIILYVLVSIYIKNINALSEVGGKE